MKALSVRIVFFLVVAAIGLALYACHQAYFV
jgi:hypothetical protein